MTLPWWSGQPSVELAVDCADQFHHLIWTDGQLRAGDHPQADRERSLVALGADPAPCIEILDRWTRHTTDLDVLTVSSRGPADPLRINGDQFSERVTSGSSSSSIQSYMLTTRRGRHPRGRGAVRGWTMYAPAPFDLDQDTDDEVTALLTMGAGLPERLVGGVIDSWAGRMERGEETAAAMPTLHAALYGRAVLAVHTWLGRSNLEVSVQMCAPNQPASMSRQHGRVQLTLPFAWLRDVWMPGLSEILGRFCLSASRVDPDRWTLQTVDPDFGAPRTVTVDLQPR